MFVFHILPESKSLQEIEKEAQWGTHIWNFDYLQGTTTSTPFEWETKKNFGEEVTLDAIEAAIDGCFRVALRRDDSVVLDTDQHAAAGAAKSANALIPTDIA